MSNPASAIKAYHRRSEAFRQDEERAYYIGMAKFLQKRGYLNLAYSHLLYAEEVGAEPEK